MTKWQKHYPLTDPNAFICLVDSMGDDSSIVQAARVSYGKDEREDNPSSYKEAFNRSDEKIKQLLFPDRDRQLIRYLLNHSHTTPFEMVEIKFMVQVPMDCWRQWVRHRTASINEYSTRYTEALDFFQVTSPQEWRLQATDNKQGSSGYLEEWTDELCPGGGIGSIPQIGSEAWEKFSNRHPTPGEFLSTGEVSFHNYAKAMYQQRLKFGVAKEQARKDLPLSTYTRAYWKCDLHNIFNFLRLRMDCHAQLEIRKFANCMFEIVKEICPVACEAFEDYVLHAKKFSRMEMECIKRIVEESLGEYQRPGKEASINDFASKPASMTDREWKDFLGKLQ